jgi:hypothetical protein
LTHRSLGGALAIAGRDWRRLPKRENLSEPIPNQRVPREMLFNESAPVSAHLSGASRVRYDAANRVCQCQRIFRLDNDASTRVLNNPGALALSGKYHGLAASHDRRNLGRAISFEKRDIPLARQTALGNGEVSCHVVRIHRRQERDVSQVPLARQSDETRFR